MSESKTPIANIFGSRILRSEQKRVIRNVLYVWDYFIQSDKDLSKALCNLSGGVYSMGSDKPKIKTTTNLKNHLKGKHHNEFKKFLDNCDAAKEKREMSAHFGTVTQCSVEPTVPKCALKKFQIHNCPRISSIH